MTEWENDPKTRDLSKKGEANLERNAETRHKRKMKVKRFLLLYDGQEIIRNLDPVQKGPQEIDYIDNGERAQKLDYTITDRNTGKVDTFRQGIINIKDINFVATKPIIESNREFIAFLVDEEIMSEEAFAELCNGQFLANPRYENSYAYEEGREEIEPE